MKKFEPLENKKIVELEDEIRGFWKKNDIFKKSIEKNSEDNLYVFYDGPPFISGLPHYGHLIVSFAKDLIPRYWTMQGKRVERSWGWDAHGLTVENKVQERLGIKNRRDIEKYGLEKFTEACYKYTSEVSSEWEWYIDRIARWVNMDDAYKTTDQDYMESVIWAFKELYEKGVIYEGVRTSLFCPTCGTPVSNFEIAMDNTYKDVEDPAVTVKFKITSDGEFKNSYILAWTTTPWTLISNKALVINEHEKYVAVNIDGEKLIVAKALKDTVFEENVGADNEFKGKELVGLSYEPLYEVFKGNKNDFKIYTFDGMVHMEEGTGIVHSAPGFGEIDTEMGKANDLTMSMALDDEGKFTAGTKNKNPYEGMFYKKADELIRKDLKEKGLLYKDELIVHRFPYHDRCNTLLIHRVQNSWFINIQDLKKQMLKNNEDINWVPSHIKNGQFVEVINNAPDWGISRTRFWATPMPVWESEDGDRIVVGSVEELEKLSGQKVKDLHRPYIDEIEIEKDGKIYKRRLEVLDSWMDAGSMSFAQFHYPFENKEKFEKNYPGDFIVEYVGQVRAWFNVMHRLSTALFGTNSFKNVISHGVLAGDDGRKMSKTYGNYTDPKKVLETVGGDALRLYFMSSPLMLGENANFDDLGLRTKSRNVLNPLLNSLKFFLIYADKNDFEANEDTKADSKNILDRWIIARLHETNKLVSENIEAYVIPPAVEACESFVDDLSRWYVRRSRSRISSGDKDALTTLYYVLLNFAKISAPIMPFMAETIFKSLSDKESVHLEDFPDFDEKFIKKSQELLKNMQEDREVVKRALSERAALNIPVRQPLNALSTANNVHYEDMVKEEVNVKEIKKSEKEVELDIEITDELKLEYTKRVIEREIQKLRKKEGLGVDDVIAKATFKDSAENKAAIDKYQKDILAKVGAESLESGSGYGIVKKS